MSRVAQIFRQLHRVAQGAAGMAAHQIRHQVLVQAVFTVDSVVAVHKGLVYLAAGLAHAGKHVRADMLRRDLQLAADVVAAQLGQEGVAFVGHEIIISDAGADEHLFHARNGAHLAKQGNQFFMADAHALAGGGVEALPVPACALAQLAVARGLAEIGRGAAHVVDVALEIGKRGQKARFLQQRFLAAGGYDAPLVKGEGAKTARAEAAAHRADGEAHLLERGHAAQRVVHRVGEPGEGQVVYAVQFLARKRQRRRVLHQVALGVLLLAQRAPTHGVLLLIFHQKGLAVRALVRGDLGMRGQEQRIPGGLLGHVAHAAQLGQLIRGHAAAHPVAAVQNGVFPHTV